MKLLATAHLSSFKTRSLNDQERDPIQRSRRIKFERQSAHMRALIAMPPRTFTHQMLRELPGRYVVHLTRISPGKEPLDEHDNLPGSLKHVVDGICDRLAIDDGNRFRIRFEYSQERGDWGVRFSVSIEQLEANHGP